MRYSGNMTSYLANVHGYMGTKSPERTRRALFSVPGADERKLSKVSSLAADSIVFDLEDGVVFERKSLAREMVYSALETIELGAGHAERAVRINAVGSGLELDDLNVVLRSNRLDALVVPKVETAQDIHFVSRCIDLIASDATKNRVRILAAIESAKGLLNLQSIAAADPRVDALIFASEDYCADVGCTRTPHGREMLFARSNIVTVAAAYGLQAIDMVCMDFKDDAVLRDECIDGRQLGFTGKRIPSVGAASLRAGALAVPKPLQPLLARAFSSANAPTPGAPAPAGDALPTDTTVASAVAVPPTEPAPSGEAAAGHASVASAPTTVAAPTPPMSPAAPVAAHSMSYLVVWKHALDA
ncbi:hypothetical protein H696_04309 [Fonticula alba]|uniref:HpcH/HpaI aldolase/citrate lyase domain-containing protein n=1 Tax=Fonticula alba TaxID=691883 RepID=A0A058Z427_FONAL|nr:hypothetical protein H696_04309 [Fonticula alba]KCV68891.1 hypothetical protein H696_04309 [Fonticula alba]|eukprot:XP_009496462.1 hypothetical protein H696_04309 [Fonticula alba]